MVVTFNVIEDMLDAIQQKLEETFSTTTDVIEVMQDSEETDLGRILQIATSKPTILVAWTGTESAHYSAKPKSVEKFSAGVFAGPVPSDERHKRVSATNIAARLARIVTKTALGNTWGVDGADRVSEPIQCDPFPAPEQGYDLVVVSSKQTIDYPDTVDPATLENLHDVYSTVTVPDSPDGETKDVFNADIPNPDE
jgi:hypothetical protein